MSMSTITASQSRTDQPVPAEGDNHELVSMTVAGQLCGVPVRQVQDVLGPQRITRVPLAPPEVAGSLNLRGRIVTAIDLRLRLDVTPQVPTDTSRQRPSMVGGLCSKASAGALSTSPTSSISRL